jgi:hypothetical protein
MRAAACLALAPTHLGAHLRLHPEDNASPRRRRTITAGQRGAAPKRAPQRAPKAADASIVRTARDRCRVAADQTWSCTSASDSSSDCCIRFESACALLSTNGIQAQWCTLISASEAGARRTAFVALWLNRNRSVRKRGAAAALLRGPVPAQMWEGVGPVPAQMWEGVGPPAGQRYCESVKMSAAATHLRPDGCESPSCPDGCESPSCPDGCESPSYPHGQSVGCEA